MIAPGRRVAHGSSGRRSRAFGPASGWARGFAFINGTKDPCFNRSFRSKSLVPSTHGQIPENRYTFGMKRVIALGCLFAACSSLYSLAHAEPSLRALTENEGLLVQDAGQIATVDEVLQRDMADLRMMRCKNSYITDHPEDENASVSILTLSDQGNSASNMNLEQYAYGFVSGSFRRKASAPLRSGVFIFNDEAVRFVPYEKSAGCGYGPSSRCLRLRLPGVKGKYILIMEDDGGRLHSITPPENSVTDKNLYKNIDSLGQIIPPEAMNGIVTYVNQRVLALKTYKFHGNVLCTFVAPSSPDASCSCKPDVSASASRK